MTHKVSTGETLRIMGVTLIIFAILDAIINVSLVVKLVGAVGFMFLAYLAETPKMKSIEHDIVRKKYIKTK